MGIALSIVFFTVAALSYGKYKSYVAPTVVVPVLWGALLFGYGVLNHGMYDLSARLYGVICLWVFSFTAGAVFFQRVRVPFKITRRDFNPTVINAYYAVVWTALPFILYTMYRMGGTDPRTFFFNIRLAHTGIVDSEAGLGMLRYVATLAIVVFLIEVYRGQCSRTRLWMLGLINVLCTMATMAKTSFFFIVFPVLVIVAFRRRISLRHIFFVLGVIVVLFCGIQLMRTGEGGAASDTLANMMNVSVFGGLPALDAMVGSGVHTGHFGELSLRFFRSVLGAFGGGYVRSDYFFSLFDEGMEGYAYVPFPTNVYTAIAPFYADFGCAGVVFFGFVTGAMAGFFFRLAARAVPWAVIAYGYICAVLMLEFYSDFLIIMLSQTLQFILLGWLACFCSARVTVKFRKTA